MNKEWRPGYEKYIKQIEDAIKELEDGWKPGNVTTKTEPNVVQAKKHYSVPENIIDLLNVINRCLYEIEKVKNKVPTTTSGENTRGKGKKEHNYKRDWELIFGKYYNILKDLKTKLENVKKNFGTNIPFKDLVIFCEAWNKMISLIDPENVVYKHINETLKYENETPKEFKDACSKKISELTSPLRDKKYKNFVKCLNEKANKKDSNLISCSLK